MPCKPAVKHSHIATECEETKDEDAIIEPKWGRNRNNTAVASRQERVPKKPKT
jgi:hypothetical protein